MLNINRLILGPVQTNCYIVSNEETKEAIVFDPAAHANEIIACLEKEDVKLKAIFLTHGHFDHMSAAEELSKQTGVMIYAHEQEEELLKSPEMNVSTMFTGKPVAVNADQFIKDQEQFTIAGIRLEVIHTPGHTAGGCCYYFPEHALLISGDTLFLTSVGRCDLPTGNYNEIVKSVKERLFKLDDDVKVLPGHGDTTTIGYEKKYNREI